MTTNQVTAEAKQLGRAYEKRIKALGFKTDNAWAKFVKIDRVTHGRHKAGSRRIPPTLLAVVGWLEVGDLVNPNNLED